MPRQDPSAPPELRAALEWLVRLKDDRAPPGLEAAFQAWLAAAPGNRAAWHEANAIWSALEPARHEYGDLLRRDRHLGRRKLIAGLGAAAVLGGAGWAASRPRLWADQTTLAGQTRQLRLEDGSRIAMGSRSALRMDLGPDQRRIVLLQGEAFFTVAPAPRPFVVWAATVSLSTHMADFNLQMNGDRVVLAVADHEVALDLPGQPPSRVARGWRAGYAAGRALAPVQTEAQDIGAWRQGRMIFRNTPLGDVLAEIARWRGGSISTLDGAVASIPVTGIFDTTQPDAALRTIVQTLGLRMWRLPGQITLIRAA